MKIIIERYLPFRISSYIYFSKDVYFLLEEFRCKEDSEEEKRFITYYKNIAKKNKLKVVKTIKEL
jgi:RNase P subunit RPR2